MTQTLRFRDHEKFHKAALFMMLGGALGGLATHIASTNAAGNAAGASPWALVIVAGAALAGVVLAAGGIGDAVRGVRGRRALIALAVAVGTFFLARFVLQSIAGAQELAKLPSWLVAMTAGIGFGAVAVVALVPRHVYIASDRVGRAFREVQGLTGEARDLSQRGYDLWRRVDSNLGEGDPSRETLEDAVLRLLATAKRWQSVETAQPYAAASDLIERVETLDQRIERASDSVARQEYARARAALAEQLRYLEDIGKSRERVLARMHNYLAAMEQLRMAVINVESTHASQDIQPLLTDLEQLGREVDRLQA
jgi:hypothetical protein